MATFDNLNVDEILNSTISDQHVCNGLALKLYSFIQTGKITGSNACKYLHISEQHAKKFTSKCYKLKAKTRTKRGIYLEELMNQTFELNECLCCKDFKLNLTKMNQTLSNVEKVNENQMEKLQVQGKERKHLKKKINQLENSRALKVEKLKTINEEMNMEKTQLKLTTRKLIDKNLLLIKKENQMKQLRKRLGNLTSEVTKLKGINKRETQLRNFELNNAKVQISELHSSLKVSENELIELRKKIKELNDTITYTETQVNNNDTIELFDKENGCFSHKTELCVHELLNNSVAMDKVPDVMRSVLKLCEKKT